MARPIRVEYAGAVYHVTARGNERKAIYRDDQDRQRFLQTLDEARQRFGLVVHGFCLMPNHYHLLVQTPRANLSAAIGWLQTTYSVRFNRRHGRSGHLFQGRFKAHLVEEDLYAQPLLTYIHLNPVRPRDKRKAIPPEWKGRLAAYRWSSHGAYAGRRRAMVFPPLCLDWLSHFGRTQAAAQAEYRRQIDARFGEVLRAPWEELRHGLVLGSEALWKKARRLLARSQGQEEIRWQRRAGADEVAQSIAALAAREGDRRVVMWLRVRLGGERMTEVARDYGYGDGSGVHQVIKRLEAKAKRDRALGAHLQALTQKVSSVKS